MSFSTTFAVVIFISSIQSGFSQVFDPFSPGLHSVFSFHVNSSVSPTIPVNLDIFAPTDADETFDLIYYLDGLGAIIPTSGYDIVLEHLASHGMVIVAPWALGTLMGPDDKVPYLESIIEWCELHLTDMLVMFGAAENITLKYDQSIALSHSAGAHIVCSYLQQGCGPFKGVAYWSPVDGVDAWGLIDNYCTEIGQDLNFVVPTLVMSASLDSVPGNNLWNGSCAPDELSNKRFYDAAGSQEYKWYINATGWGHGDFMDPFFQNMIAATHFCAVNREANALEFSAYRDHVAGEVVAFIRSLFESDCETYTQFMQDSNLMPVAVANEYFAPSSGCPQPSCVWTPIS